MAPLRSHEEAARRVARGVRVQHGQGREKTTKTDSSKHIPVHPTLAAMLAEWKLGGWAAMMGRHPEPDDLIVPLPPEHATRRRTRTGQPFRGHYYSGDRWRREDLPTLGWRHRRHYDMRATFITLVLEDGADQHIIETRVTHTRKRRSAFDGYNRGLQWERTCGEVAKLKISRRPMGQGEVIALPVAAGAEGGTQPPIPTPLVTARATQRNRTRKILVHSRRQRACTRSPHRTRDPRGCQRFRSSVPRSSSLRHSY